MSEVKFTKEKSRSLGANHLFARYKDDPQFHAIVQQLFSFMVQMEVQPYEVKDAAFVAETLYHDQFVRHNMFYRKINNDD